MNKTIPITSCFALADTSNLDEVYGKEISGSFLENMKLKLTYRREDSPKPETSTVAHFDKETREVRRVTLAEHHELTAQLQAKKEPYDGGFLNSLRNASQEGSQS